MLEDLNLNDLQNPDQARAAIVRLLNLVEELSADNQALRAEVQRLRDENNRLKGEHGQPSIKPNQPKQTESAAADHSSEARRHKPQTWKKTSQLDALSISREEVLKVDPARLPPDAEVKEYVPVVVQDAHLQTETIRFLKEKHYSATTRQTYLAELPRGYQGQFGPNVKALAVVLYFAGNMSEPKLLEFFRQAGLRMSAGELSNLLIKDHDRFHAEKDAVYSAGLSSSAWQNTAHTGTRVNGQNQQCQIVCNPLYTAYFTTAKKDRLSVLQVLQNNRALTFRFKAETQRLLETLKVPAGARARAATVSAARALSQPEVEAWLNEQLPKLGAQQRARVLDAAAVAAYHAQVEFPVIRLLVCDDAPQFNWVTDELALCWIHEARHYQKLEPVVAQHRTQLEDFQDDCWAFYAELLKYREQPRPAERPRLDAEFDRLFATVTGYAALDARIAMTRAKQHCLLLVLTHPEIPLHNNPAELGARQRVRKGDVSFGPRRADGVQAWDTFMTLAATAKKLGVSFYAYVRDRISGANQLPKLADLITERARRDPLDASWSSP